MTTGPPRKRACARSGSTAATTAPDGAPPRPRRPTSRPTGSSRPWPRSPPLPPRYRDRLLVRRGRVSLGRLSGPGRAGWSDEGKEPAGLERPDAEVIPAGGYGDDKANNGAG